MTWTALHDAVQHHNVEEVLQRAKAHPEEAVSLDDHRSTPLHMACWEHPNLAIVEALIQAYPQGVVEQNTHGDTPLHVLLSNPAAPLDCVKALVDASPAVVFMANKEGLMPLHKLCRHDPANHDVLEFLLEAYPHALKTPIKMGDPAPKKHSESLSQPKDSDHFVLSTSPHSAMDLEFRDRQTQVRDGAYPLHMALASTSRKATFECIEMLIHGAPEVLSMTNKYGETPLHVALSHHAPAVIIEHMLCNPEDKEGHPKTPETLCGCAALSMAEKRHGNLPIHVAAMHGCPVSVALLFVELKPETIRAKNSHDMTPYDVAMFSGKCTEDILHLWKV